MQSKAASVTEYLASLPADRKAAIEAVISVVRSNLDADYEETMQYGMIGWSVPHRVFPAGYHTDSKQPLPFVALASQKNHMALYMMGIYSTNGEPSFRAAWAKTGKKLDMGKACIRFKRVDDLALDVIGDAIKRVPAKTYVKRYLAIRAALDARPVKGPPRMAAKPARAAKPNKKSARRGRA